MVLFPVEVPLLGGLKANLSCMEKISLTPHGFIRQCNKHGEHDLLLVMYLYL
jgi:hypothetical protein